MPPIPPLQAEELLPDDGVVQIGAVRLGLGLEHDLAAWTRTEAGADDTADWTLRATELAQSQTQAMAQLLWHGRFNEAFQAGRRTLPLWHQLRRPDRSAGVMLTMAQACLEHEQGLEALALARHAFTLARLHRLPLGLTQSLTVLAAIHGRLMDFGAGESLALQALSRARDLHQPAAVLQAMDSLLAVLTQAHEALAGTDDAEAAEATAQRLLRRANHALGQSSYVPQGFEELQLRNQAAAALLACGHATEAVRVLRGCMEAARRQDYRVAGLWARLYTTLGHLLRTQQYAALTGLELLLPQLQADDPPRLRLAVLKAHADAAQRCGDQQLAHRQRAAALPLQEAHLRQAVALKSTLQRSADDIMAALAVVDREWLEQGPAATGPAPG